MLLLGSRGTALEPPKPRPTNAELIERAIERMGARLEKDDLKGSVGDLIRLLQLQKDLGFDQPTQVIVQWVDKIVE